MPATPPALPADLRRRDDTPLRQRVRLAHEALLAVVNDPQVRPYLDPEQAMRLHTAERERDLLRAQVTLGELPDTPTATD